jgi:uncharacterized protein YbjT (DUF2867 family)
MSDKVIAVVGATGAQGGSLVQAILADQNGEFAVRALTRDPGSERARALAARGAEVVQADLDDEASLRSAFTGAHGVYVVTNFWEQRTPEQVQERSATSMETEQAKHAAQAAKDAGVRHVIWSTLADTRQYFHAGDGTPTIEGTYKVPHADAKAEADRFFVERGVPVTFLQANVYYEAFLGSFAPRRNKDGSLILAQSFGDARVPAQTVADVGRTALGIFKRGRSMIGKRVSVAGDVLTGQQFANAFSEVLGELVAYQPLPPEVIRGSGSPRADEVANMQMYFVAAEKDIVDLIDSSLLRDLNPQLEAFETWLDSHKDALSRS